MDRCGSLIYTMPRSGAPALRALPYRTIWSARRRQYVRCNDGLPSSRKAVRTSAPCANALMILLAGVKVKMGSGKTRDYGRFGTKNVVSQGRFPETRRESGIEFLIRPAPLGPNGQRHLQRQLRNGFGHSPLENVLNG